eukprot:441569-Pelagomonas_calceolata.AAC.1
MLRQQRNNFASITLQHTLRQHCQHYAASHAEAAGQPATLPAAAGHYDAKAERSGRVHGYVLLRGVMQSKECDTGAV